MLPSETMIWQPEFTDKTLSRKTGAVHPETRGQKNAKKYLRALLPVTIRKSDFSGRFLCHI
nr:hypothetical protein [Escherichia coli]